jgi:cytochrome P450
MMLLSVMTANRDPGVWAEPDAFVVDRFESTAAPKLLSFGTGAHYCLGASLARMTLEEAVLGLAANPLTPTTDLDEVDWRVVLGRSPVTLPVAVA